MDVATIPTLAPPSLTVEQAARVHWETICQRAADLAIPPSPDAANPWAGLPTVNDTPSFPLTKGQKLKVYGVARKYASSSLGVVPHSSINVMFPELRLASAETKALTALKFIYLALRDAGYHQPPTQPQVPPIPASPPLQLALTPTPQSEEELRAALQRAQQDLADRGFSSQPAPLQTQQHIQTPPLHLATPGPADGPDLPSGVQNKFKNTEHTTTTRQSDGYVTGYVTAM